MLNEALRFQQQAQSVRPQLVDLMHAEITDIASAKLQFAIENANSAINALIPPVGGDVRKSATNKLELINDRNWLSLKALTHGLPPLLGILKADVRKTFQSAAINFYEFPTS